MKVEKGFTPHKKNSSFFCAGFTLLEVLLSIACISIIAGIAIPVYQSFQIRNDLSIASTTIAQSLRRAQILSQSSAGDTTSGVKIQSGSIVVFQGTTYAGRDTSLDESFNLPVSITPTGIDEIIFSKLTGFPSTTGTITLTSNINEIKTITINEKGTVTY
jgi:prepilin-type N-terminal cleavage/methylation domain-containing protein